MNMKTRSQTKKNLEHSSVQEIAELPRTKPVNGTVHDATAVNVTAELSEGSQSVESDRDANPRHVSNSSGAGAPRVQPDQDANFLQLPDLAVEFVAGATPDRELIDFVQNLRKAEISDDILTLPGGGWIGGSSDLAFLRGRFLVRQCYRDLKSIMMRVSATSSMNKFLITGNPGIGKSMFTYFMMHEFMKANVDAGEKNRKSIVWKPFGIDTFVCITSTTVLFADDIRAFEEELNKMSTWYVVDSEPPKRFMATTLLVTSPAKEISKEFRKRGVATRYMPVWTQQEMDKAVECGLALAQDGGTKVEDDEVVCLYSKWGGVPRYVFHYAHNKVEQEGLEDALKNAKMDVLSTFLGETTVGDGCHKLMHMKVEVDADEDDRYQCYVMEFASEYVRQRLFLRASKCSHEEVKNYINDAAYLPQVSVFRGMLCEAYMHTFLLTDREFKVRRLDTNASAKKKPFFVKFGQLVPKEFDDLNEIVAPTEQDYWQSTSRNFNAVHSLLYPSNLFQMTVAGTHVLDSGELQDVVSHMVSGRKGKGTAKQAHDNLKLYFVVPYEKFDKFIRQQYSSGQPAFKGGVHVEQYVLQADVPSSYFADPMRH